MKRVLSFEVNDSAREVLFDLRQTLLEVLRDNFHLWGVKEGCGNGNCGSCTVLVDGNAVNSCLVFAAECEGASVTTVEGLASEELHPIQQSFVAAGALECGFCTPGFIMSAHALLRDGRDPSEDEIRRVLSGNLCRCTGYDKIVRAVQSASRSMAGRSESGNEAGALDSPDTIGTSIPKVAAAEMVTGKAAYGADVDRPGMLEAAFVRSPHAHARILSIDTSRAEQLPGVRAVVTRADYPAHGLDGPEPANVPDDVRRLFECSMAGDRALYHGQAVAAVAADDRFIAQQAAELIQVTYEPLPHVLDIDAAMAADAPVIHDWIVTTDAFGGIKGVGPSNVAAKHEWELGDVERGFDESEAIVEREYRTAATHQGYIEPQASVAEWSAGADVTVWATTQGSFNCQGQIASILRLPLSKVRVVPMEVGGAFGGKISTIIDIPTVLLARKAHRPVRAVLGRDEVLRASGGAAASIVKVKAGCDSQGRITSMKIWCAYDAGCLPGSPAANGGSLATSAYRIANLHTEGYDVLTNKAKTTAYRAPGMPQIAFAVEQTVDALAAAIGMDPVEFRLLNVAGEGDIQANETPHPRVGFRQVLEAAREHPHWRGPKPSKPGSGRGVAVGFWRNNQNTSACEVHIHSDGTVAVTMGAIDISGTRTALTQIAAHELQVNVGAVRVEFGDTQTAPFNAVSAGSRITYSSSDALHKACQAAIGQLRIEAAAEMDVAEDQVVFAGGEFRVDGKEEAISMKTVAMLAGGTVVGVGTSQGLPLHPTISVCICDVDVDSATGRVRIERFTCLQDVGKAINPARIEAQMQGGAAQGLGWGLTEEVIFGADGSILNPSLLDYRHLTSLDLPMIDCEIIEVTAAAGPYGVRGVGETPIIAPAAAVANAINDAVGVWCDHAPMTPERLYAAISSGASNA